MDHRLSELPRTSLREQVANAIRNAIVEGKWGPGTKIPEMELAEQLGVSRTPVREATRMLEQQGLVEIRPKSGTYIATVDLEEAQDSLRVRVALEQLAVQQAVERLNAEEWDELCTEFQALLDRMLEAEEQGDWVVITELDIEWHTMMIDAARNECLSRTWRSAGLATFIWSTEREIYPLTQQDLALPQNRHRELLTAMRDRKPAQCAAAIQDHIFVKLDDLRDRQNADAAEERHTITSGVKDPVNASVL